jgi:fructokinase
MRIGVDLGGTKIEGIAIDDAGAERLRRRVSTPTDGYQAIIDAIRALVVGIERDLGSEASVGVGIPGAISPATGLVKNANTTALIGHALDQDLSRALGRPVRAANDANCFALSEASDGAAAGAEVVFGVIVGTGTGGGLVVRGHVLTGPNAIAGEWGHSPLPWPTDEERPGPACYCGKHGCIETWLAGPSLARDHQTRTGVKLGAPEIARLADQGERDAQTTLARYTDRMSRALATVINLLDPDVIVLGGGVSNIARLYQDVPARWGAYVFSDVVRTRLVPPQHGDSSGVRGAAWLWPRAT